MSKNIIMSEHTDSRYEELYPKTVASQISDVYSKSETSNLFLPKSGGSMGGILDMSGNKITNLADPTNSLDSANKKYVDESSSFKKVKVVNNRNITATDTNGTIVECDIPEGYTLSDFLRFKAIGHEITLRSASRSDSSLIFPSDAPSKNKAAYIRFYEIITDKTVGILLTANFNVIDSTGLQSLYSNSGQSSLILRVNIQTNKLLYYVRSSLGDLNFDITTYVYF